jgi:hypothetical protein
LKFFLFLCPFKLEPCFSWQTFWSLFRFFLHFELSKGHVSNLLLQFERAHFRSRKTKRKSFDYFVSFKPLFFPFQNSRIS